MNYMMNIYTCIIVHVQYTLSTCTHHMYVMYIIPYLRVLIYMYLYSAYKLYMLLFQGQLEMSCDVHESNKGVQLYGFIGDTRVQADLAMVDDTIHVFTNVSHTLFINCIVTQYHTYL